jgi:asparagine synthase (glutamine-hydrolysing)
MEEPVCEPPAVALHFVSALARRTGVKVLLSGEGGDEAFGGYPEYRNLLILERLKAAVGPARGLLRTGFGLLEAAGSKRLGRYGRLIDLPLHDYYLSRTATPFSGFNARKAELYAPAFASRVESATSSNATRALFDAVADRPTLDRMLYVDTCSWLPDDLLVKADKMTMATSVELRVPLLDYQVLEFAASLPAAYKVNGWQLKRILKAALKDSVPSEILKRKKTGFPVPYDRWLAGELKEFAHDTLLAESAGLNTWFSRAEVARILEAHDRGEGHAKEVFSLLVFELWHASFMSQGAFTRYAAAV